MDISSIATDIIYARFSIRKDIFIPGQNKIVVDYDFESLLCLGMIDHQTGKELSRSEIEQWCATNDF